MPDNPGSFRVTGSIKGEGSMKSGDPYLRPLLGALVIAVLPHIPALPVWVLFWCAGSWGYLWFTGKKGPVRINRHIVLLLAVLGLIAVLSGAGKTLGGSTYIALLVVTAGLKPMETHTHRDRMVLVFLAYFIVIAALFQSESLTITLYMFLSVFITTAVLIRVNHPSGDIRFLFGITCRIMIYAVPMMILLFLLFPRIHGNMWGVRRSDMGRTGFTDRMAPGMVSAMSTDDTPAFRANFQGTLPPPESRYWRGIVFWFYDGRAWNRGVNLPELWRPATGGKLYEYDITLEPHRQRWLFALDVPVSRPRRTRILADHTLYARMRVRRKIRYHVSSRTGGAVSRRGLGKWEKPALLLPADKSIKARALGEKWRETLDTKEQIVQTALSYFREGGFTYTLSPPLAKEDVIDEFLFENRIGYCEHFASAFTFLMRSAGIPARMVGGYLGGVVNPYGNYLLVRQSDAHVWSEVWLENKGWIRIDPTLEVAPQRIMPQVQTAAGAAQGGNNRRFFGRLFNYFQELRFGWDAVSAQWDIWFVGYSLQTQQDVLSKIGLAVGSWKWMIIGLFFGSGLAVFMGVFVFYRIWNRASANMDRIQRDYLLLCEKLARIDIPRKPGQGPQNYSKKVVLARPDLAEPVNRLIRLYIQLRYGKNEGNNAKNRFHHQKRFNKALSPQKKTMILK